PTKRFSSCGTSGASSRPRSTTRSTRGSGSRRTSTRRSPRSTRLGTPWRRSLRGREIRESGNLKSKISKFPNFQISKLPDRLALGIEGLHGAELLERRLDLRRVADGDDLQPVGGPVLLRDALHVGGGHRLDAFGVLVPVIRRQLVNV